MAKLNQAQEQTMEEILASIRRMISDDEARAAAQPKMADARASDPARPAGNVSRLFAESETRQSLLVSPSPPEEAAPSREASDVVEIAMDEETMEADTAPTEEEIAPPVPMLTAGTLPMPSMPGSGPTQLVEERSAAPLLSPRADAAVASAFDQFASTMLSGSARTIDDLVEDLLRPMLRTWLDANLPPLVERLVREEIERVSRGRR